MQRALLIVTVYAIYLVGWACVAQQRQSGNHPANDKATHIQEPSAQTHVAKDPALPSFSANPSSPTKSQDTQEKPLPRFIRPEWVIVYITAAYSLIAGLTLWVIKRQADTMEAQAEDARQTAASAAQTTKETLEAIQRQAKEMSRQNKNMISRERARIAVTILPLDTLRLDDANFINLIIENLGPTHALNVRTKGCARPIIDGFDYPDLEPDDLLASLYGTGNNSIFGVESVLRANAQPSAGRLILFFPTKWEDSIESSKPRITIEAWGSVEYDDVFGQGRTTRFKYLMHTLSDTKLPNTDHIKVSPLSYWAISGNPDDNCST